MPQGAFVRDREGVLRPCLLRRGVAVPPGELSAAENPLFAGVLHVLLSRAANDGVAHRLGLDHHRLAAALLGLGGASVPALEAAVPLLIEKRRKHGGGAGAVVGSGRGPGAHHVVVALHLVALRVRPDEADADLVLKALLAHRVPKFRPATDPVSPTPPKLSGTPQAAAPSR